VAELTGSVKFTIVPRVTVILIGRQLLVEAWRIVCRHRWSLLIAGLGVAVGGLLILPFDHRWNEALIDQRPSAWMSFARQASWWGDYPRLSLILPAALWLLGLARHRSAWQTAAVACLLAATLAGLEVNAVRLTTGRPRPRAQLADGFYGPSLNSNYQSFPSAHTGTSFGTATALAVIMPPVGIPLVIGAGCVGWSRLYLNCHFATDVWVGAWVGILTGLVFGLSARHQRR
jgi:membrane-associated phospholipid phosphatase